MTPAPQEEAKDRTVPEGTPLDTGEAARYLSHLGMTPDSARTYAAFVCGRYAAFHRPA
jgi:hypothetical protein